MTKPLELYVTLFVPENLLPLCCSRHFLDLDSDYKFDKDDFLEDIDDIEGLYVKDPVPQAYKGNKYKLSDIDPQRLDYLIQMIKTAPDAQLEPDRSDKNDEFKKLLKEFNDTNQDGYNYTVADIVRLLGRANYKHSWVVTETEKSKAKNKKLGHPSYDKWEFHEFTKIDLPGFTTNHDTHIYIKIAAPMRRRPNKFKVVSLHHSGAEK